MRFYMLSLRLSFLCLWIQIIQANPSPLSDRGQTCGKGYSFEKDLCSIAICYEDRTPRPLQYPWRVSYCGPEMLSTKNCDTQELLDKWSHKCCLWFGCLWSYVHLKNNMRRHWSGIRRCVLTAYYNTVQTICVYKIEPWCCRWMWPVAFFTNLLQESLHAAIKKLWFGGGRWNEYWRRKFHDHEQRGFEWRIWRWWWVSL